MATEAQADAAPITGFYRRPAHGWTCFHCGETFMSEGSARDHFGAEPFADPGCRIKVGAERGLLLALRDAEAQVTRLTAALHSENTEALRQLRRLQGRISDIARDAEQEGYDRALRDVEAGKVEPEHARRILAALGKAPPT